MQCGVICIKNSPGSDFVLSPMGFKTCFQNALKNIFDKNSNSLEYFI